jgi:4-hydroxy-2-oxoheptanedioate aldolase
MPEPLRDALAGGRRLVGTVLTLPGAALAELIAEPFDLVWIDLEHGALDLTAAQDLLIGAQAAGAHALVRLPADDHRSMTAMLDAGADGIVLADVRDAATAATAAARALHPPQGVRGYGLRRAATRGRTRGAAPQRPALWAQIESTAGVAAAAAIAAVPGVDALAVGTADLSFALGVPLRQDAPALLDAAAAVRGACVGDTAYGVAGALDGAPPALLAGAAFAVHGTDARLWTAAADGSAARLRAALDPDAQEAD